MGVTREDANDLLREWVTDPSLRRHCHATAVLMKAAAGRYGEAGTDPERWAIAGLLHDADYERWPEDHPQRIVSWLEARDEPEIAHAIAAHHTSWGVPLESQLDRALLACDELGGFVVAYALMRPNGFQGMKPSGVSKKLKDKSFAAGVDRGEVLAGAEALDVDLAEHVAFVIETLSKAPPVDDDFGSEVAGIGRESS
jgi:predicted hydrolase (HD superfamily)